MRSGLAGIIVIVTACFFFCVSNAAHSQGLRTSSSPSMERDYVAYFESELAKAGSDKDKAGIKRKLIAALISVADQRVPTGSTSARVRALARVDSLYQELEDRGPKSEEFYGDCFEHAYFLANHGFGQPVPFSYYLRRPEPDYPRALVLYEKASGTPDLKLREQAKAESERILAPLIYMAKMHYSDTNLVLAIAIRNLDLVLMKLECQDQPPRVIREWSVNFTGTLDHEVQIHYYRIQQIPECNALLATATSVSGVTQSYSLSTSDKQLWAGRQFPLKDYQSNKVVEAVSEVPIPTGSRVFSQHHSYNQVCSLCHIPHNAGE